MVEEKKVLLEVAGLEQYFNVGRGDEVKAIDDISFHILEGETLGLVGESESEKLTAGRSVIRLYDPTAGETLFDRKDISKVRSKADMQTFRRNVQIVSQDPYAPLNPRMKVDDTIAEGIDVSGLAKTLKGWGEKINELLRTVGLDPSHSTRYPYEFSGGQYQRIGATRALAVNPRFVTCDESISVLDVSTQTQVVNLLQDLQKEQDLTYLLIVHDLSTIKHTSGRIGVMHSGKLLEMGTSDDVYNFGVHPYTGNLLSVVPLSDPDYERTRKRIVYQPVTADGKGCELRKIPSGHYIYCAENEVTVYRKKTEEKKRRVGL